MIYDKTKKHMLSVIAKCLVNYILSWKHVSFCFLTCYTPIIFISYAASLEFCFDLYKKEDNGASCYYIFPLFSFIWLPPTLLPVQLA